MCMRASAKWSLPFLLLLPVFATIPVDVPTTANHLFMFMIMPAAATSDTGDFPTLTQSSFGFQCGTGKPTNCPNSTWPTSIAQPGLIRLWDSQVQWSGLNRGPGDYNWKILDAYLDTIAAHQPRDAMYTFGYTPCWDIRGKCERYLGSTSPPKDLGEKGSPSFNTFVTALVTHCSPAGHCVKDYIKYWEMWNEANADYFWTGSVPQLYDLVSPAVAIIRSKVSGSIVLTPAVNMSDAAWMREWINEENTRGRLSDIYSIHLYTLDHTPEQRFHLIQKMIELKNSTPGWIKTPWANTETNFDAQTFACDSQFNSEDCIGQMVRWNLLQYALGAQNVSWFFFNTTIGRNPEYANAYHEMMQWLVGGHFTAAKCSLDGTVISCPFVPANGHHAMFVWNFGGNSSYHPSSEYTDYKTLNGKTVAVSKGETVTIGAKPIMLEAPN